MTKNTANDNMLYRILPVIWSIIPKVKVPKIIDILYIKSKKLKYDVMSKVSLGTSLEYAERAWDCMPPKTVPTAMAMT